MVFFGFILVCSSFSGRVIHKANAGPTRAVAAAGMLVEPLTIATKALIQVWDVQERVPWGRHAMARPERSTARGAFSVPQDVGHGLRAVVLGAGPVGLLTG